MSKVVFTTNAPLPAPCLSQAVVAGEMIYCSGQLPIDPKTGKLVGGNIKDRTRQILRNLDAVLVRGGSSLLDVFKVTVFLTDMADVTAVNDVFSWFFGSHKPACTCIAVKSLPLGTDVEVECSGVLSRSLSNL
ncbi:YjgF/Yer057p/UK114 family [Penicillium angulare]|uniref:YjgF/Yer057p/UK114 family n=1 Tax=Penicillium angulare TaxID=116970 RepID=A0A9W9FBE8_9EURO|nr:YjgF/Yer057p/UK114 family [Penicillium angulare]